MPITDNDKKIIQSCHLPKKFITIAIGGRQVERIFNHWKEVVDEILAQKIAQKIVLVGAENAKEYTQEITQKYPNQVINMVNQYSFNQSAQIIKKSDLLVCVDGGLLHAANAVNTPMVSLFAYIDPSFRLIKNNPSIGLLDKNINHIKINSIMEKIKLLKKNLNNGK